MSHLLDQSAKLDSQRAEDLARSDAALIASMFPLEPRRCRAGGNHLVAQNDEREPTEADFIAADLARDAGKGERLAARDAALAGEAQLVEFRARGWI